jgi:hypothetical protein
MRTDDEQLRHMERQEERGELSPARRERMKVLRQIVQENKGEVRQPRDHVESNEPVASRSTPSKGYTFFEKVNNFIGNSPQDKAFRDKKKAAYDEAYKTQTLKNQRILAQRKAKKELNGGGGIGGNFITSSLQEIGGMAQGASSFTFGGSTGGGRHQGGIPGVDMGMGYGSRGPRRKVRKGKKRRRRIYTRSSGYSGSNDLLDFIR